MKMDIVPGRPIIEAGTGSGGLTLAFARAVHPDGHVTSHDSRAHIQDVARENLNPIGLPPYVTLKHRDIHSGFDERNADALFLDAPNPGDHVGHAHAALSGMDFFGSILPTANQVINLIQALEAANFCLVEVEEILLRPCKTGSARLRPKDQLTPHTEYLIFGRKLITLED